MIDAERPAQLIIGPRLSDEPRRKISTLHGSTSLLYAISSAAVRDPLL